MASVEIIEWPLLKVPFESLKRSAKDRKSILDEISESLQAASKLNSVDSRLHQLGALLDNLQSLKRKLDSVSQTESEEAHRCKARLEHLSDIGLPNKNAVIPWTGKRIDRLIVDQLLRSGLFTSAEQLVSELGIVDLVELNIFFGAKKIVDSLKRHNCEDAIAWCTENSSKLKKFKSKLEFKLRVQEFIELVKKGEKLAAIFYARQHMSPWASLYTQDLQRAVTTLVFPSTTKCEHYREFFEEEQWQKLIDLFMKDLYRLHNLPPESLLTIHLQAGISALKTPLSYQPGCNQEDPLHLPKFQTLAKDLPYSNHSHSKLICSITREIMSDANPPMVLPNGYVYSQKAITNFLTQSDGRILCPKTGLVCGLDELRRAFIV